MKRLTGRLARLLKRHRGFLLFLVTMAVFRTAVADWNYVPSGSMEPTLVPGDVLVVNKLAYGPAVPFTETRLFSLGEPERGDIITFFPSHTDQCLVKRVIGVPGDRLEFRGRVLRVNGERVSVEKTGVAYREHLPGKSHLVNARSSLGDSPLDATVVVPEGKYFVMGDNRDSSFDSRYWGFVDERQVVGKVAAVGVSFSRQFFARLAYRDL